MTCLETTFLIDLLRGDQNAKLLKGGMEHLGETVVAAPSVMEIWAEASEKQREKINQLLESIPTLPLDEKAAKMAAEIETDLFRQGKIIQVEDIMIAAIAKVNNQTLVTRDSDYA